MDELDSELLAEFHTEVTEHLGKLDAELVECESGTTPELIASVFRSFHTIKGTSGFFGLHAVEGLAHEGENLLSEVREGRLVLDEKRISALLECVDGLRTMLDSFVTSSTEGDEDYSSLRLRIAQLASPDATETTETTEAQTTTETPAAPDETPAVAEQPQAAAPAAAVEPVPAAAPAPAAPAEPAAPAKPKDQAPKQEAAKADTAKPADAAAETIRVDVNLLDDLVTLVGELVLVRNQLRSLVADQSGTEIFNSVGKLSMLASDLQGTVMKSRMQPMSQLWGKFPRIVRDLSAQLGKKVTLEVAGGETELDRTLIEAIKDPMTHLVRNAIDHGIESPADRKAAGKPEKGTLSLTARHEGGTVRIEIADDGAGLNVEKIRNKAVSLGLIDAAVAADMSTAEAANLIFLPGFSTADAVTSVSGRGVGMDVVKTHIERIGGSLSLATRPGNGTTITANIPLTLAIMQSLIVASEGWRYAIAQSSVEELVRVADADVHTVSGVRVLRLRGALLPLVDLAGTLGMESHEPAFVVIVREGSTRYGLLVDQVLGTEEVVVKPPDPMLYDLTIYAGSTIMGDGTVALILDAARLAEHAHVSDVRDTAAEAAAASNETTLPVVLCRAGDASLAIPLSAVDRLETVPAADVEHAAGQRTLQYRGGLLPLLPAAPGAGQHGQDLSVVVVPAEHTRLGLVGLIVDEVTDITDAEVIGGTSTEDTAVRAHGRVADLVSITHATAGAR